MCIRDSYVIEVTLDGEPDAVTGMVVDLKRLKIILEDEVIEPMDHRFLNHEVAPFNKIVPTTENLALEIWRRLAARFESGPARLHRVRVYETNDIFVDILSTDVTA